MNAPVFSRARKRKPVTFRRQQLEASRISFYARCVALALSAVIIAIITPWPAPLYLYAILMVFVASGWLTWQSAKRPWGRPWHQIAILIFDFALLTFVLTYPNPLSPIEYPPQFGLRFGSFIYLFIILSALAYSLRPALVITGAIAGSLSWIIAVVIMMQQPGATWAPPDEPGIDAFLKVFFNPHHIDLGIRFQEIATFLICSGILTLAVYRSRKIVLEQVSAAEERANLARYFPDTTVEYLAGKSNPFAEPREQEAGVLFADIIGFTGWAEQRRPIETITYLREVQKLLTEEVFRNNGTLDKFIGDGLMATFGTTEDRPEEAAEAILCGIAMLRAHEKWREGKSDGEGGALRLAIGVHFGPVILGDVGSDQRLEFAVLGDTVNVAARLEAATRQVGCNILFSSAAVESARVSGMPGIETILQGLKKLDPIALKGKQQTISVYTLA